MHPGSPQQPAPYREPAAGAATFRFVALVATAYFLLAAGTLSFITSLSPYVSPFWPSAGLALAAVLLGGTSCAPAIFAGALAANLYAGAAPLVALGIAAGNTLEAAAAFWLLGATTGRSHFERMVDILRFVGVVAVVCTANAFCANAVLAAGGAIGFGFLPVVHWGVGDFAGMLVVAPLVLAHAGGGNPYRGRGAEAALMLLTASAATALLFFSTPDSTLGYLGKFPFLLLPFGLWAAMRFGLSGTTAMAAIITAIAIAGTRSGRGPFDPALGPHAMLLLALFAAVLAFTGLLASAVDAHRRREAGLTRESALLQQILDGLPVGVWTANRGGDVVSSNPAGAGLLASGARAGAGEYGKVRLWRGAAPEPVPPDETPLAQAVSRQEKIVDELFEIEGAHGSRKTVLVSAWPLYESGAPAGAVAVHQDVSALYAADKSVRELFAVVEQTQDVVFITRCDGTIEYVNPAFEQLTGYAREEAVGQQPSLLKSGEHGPAFYKDMWDGLLAGRPYSGIVANRKKDGDVFYESKTISPLRDKSGRITHFVSTGKDMTESIRAEAALRAHAVHQRVVASFGQRALAGGSVSQLMSEAVRSMCSALGVRYCEVVMLTADAQALALQAGAGWDEARAETVIPLVSDCVETAALRSGEAVLVQDYGEQGTLPEPPYAAPGSLRSSVAAPIPGREGPLGVLAAHAEQQRAFHAEERSFAQAMANTLGALIQRNEAEERLHELNTALEARIEERTRELAEANRELEAANEELNAFAYSVSHDLRGTLRRVQGFSSLVLGANRGRLDDNSVRQLERIQANAEHMGALVDDLLHLSRIARHKLACTSFDFSAMALSIAATVREAHGRHAPELAIEPNLRAYGDQHLVRLALGNLLDNAWKFTRRTPAPRIEVGRQPAPVPTFFVKDNGAGFDARYAAKLFEPFERLHSEDEFEGTGIGLSIVQRAIAKHGGRAWAESRTGAGACFYFTLPVR